jgi:iron complex transport system substrate-binding protein
VSHLARQVSLVLVVIALLAACAPAAPASPTLAPPTPTVAPTATLAPPSPTPPPPTVAPSPSPTTATAPATTSNAAPAAGFPVTVTDDAGRTVTFDRPPRRIISLSPGHTETLYALGLGDAVIETDTYSDYPAANQPKAKLKTYPKPNVEEIVAQQPDLVVSLVEGDELFQPLDAHGIKGLHLYPTTFDGALKDIDLLGRVTGTTDRATALTASMRERAAAVVAKTTTAPKPTVVYELDASDPTKPFVAGPAGFYGDLIPMAGGTNAFGDLKSAASQVSAEQIIARNPDVILLGDSLVPVNPQTPAMVKARTGWSQIRAVQNNRVLVLDDSLLSRPGPRLIDGLEQLAKALHPELFP